MLSKESVQALAKCYKAKKIRNATQSVKGCTQLSANLQQRNKTIQKKLHYVSKLS